MSRVLENFAIRLKKDVQDSLKNKEQAKAGRYGGSANGNSRLWGTIKIILDPATDAMEVTLVMEDYWKYVDKGRKAAGVSRAGQSKIIDWVKRKGVNPSRIIDDMKAKEASKKEGRFLKQKRRLQKLKSNLAFW